MRKNLTSPLVVAILALAVGACYSPTSVGDGRMHDVRMALDLDTGFLHVVPGEKSVLLETRGVPRGTILVYGPDMAARDTRHVVYDTLAVSRTAPEAVGVSGDRITLYQVPEFRAIGEIKEPEGALFDRETTILATPAGDGYVFVTGKPGRPNVWRLDGATKTFGAPGRSTIPGTIRGHAMDDRTGFLVLTNDGDDLEVFDTTAMKSVRTVKIPAHACSFGLVAIGGVAWVGTTDGRLVPVDLASGKVGEPVGLGGPGEVSVARSATGRFLVAASQDRGARRPPYPTNLRVYYVDGEKLTGVASSFMETRGDLVDMAMLESRETVVLAATWDLLAWDYGKVK